MSKPITGLPRLLKPALACAMALGLMCVGKAPAQDSSDVFLQAYTLFQTGEQLESEDDPRRALLRYREADRLLTKVSADDPDWQPLVVGYRLKKTQENIVRLEALTANMPPLEEELEGELPRTEAPARATARPLAPLPPVTTSQSPGQASDRASRPPPSRPVAVPPATDSGALSKALRDLAEAKKELASAKSQNQTLTGRLEKSEAELKSALFEIDRTKVNVVELRSELAQARQTIENVKRDGGDAGDRSAIRAERQAETAEFLKKLAEANADTEVLREENEQLLAKLEAASTYISSSDDIREGLIEERTTLDAARMDVVEQLEAVKKEAEAFQARIDEADEKIAAAEKQAEDERTARAEETGRLKELGAEVAELITANQALAAEVAKAKASGADKKELDRLAEENRELTSKLAAARSEMEDAGGAGTASLALQSELNSVNDKLLQAEAEIARRDARIEDLARQLDETSGELARLRLLPVPTSEEQKLLAENDLLRGIILRQIKLQNRRDQARQALQSELDSLKIESATLQAHLDVLASPVLELYPDERSLFKDPVSLLTESEPSRLEVDIAIIKPTTEEAVSNLKPKTPEGASSLTPEARELVRSAQQLFNEKNYEEAEKTYRDIVEMLPDNYFVLSNLGAVQIEAGKLSAAEIALGKAIAISPDDSFAHTHLGIAYSRQGRFDDARRVLVRATELNTEDAVAFNYLGVCLAQQGLREMSETNLKRAIDLDPNYANAHFNLAVLYATTKPPAVELAKQHYDLATQLGANPDPSLERLIQ